MDRLRTAARRERRLSHLHRLRTHAWAFTQPYLVAIRICLATRPLALTGVPRLVELPPPVSPLQENPL